MQRITTTAKRIIEHYELDKQNNPRLYTCLDAFNIVMNEFGGKHEWTSPDNYFGDNKQKVSEYVFDNGLKVHGDFELNEFKQYQLKHLVFGS